MPKRGMLGESEVLRGLWRGPLLELLVRLNGPDGLAWEDALKRLLRTQNPLERWKPQFSVEVEGAKVDFAAVTPAVLGFEGKTRRRSVIAEASARGLTLCPRGTTRAAFNVCKELCCTQGRRLILAEKPSRKDEKTITLTVFYGTGQAWLEAPVTTDFFFEPEEQLLFVVV